MLPIAVDAMGGDHAPAAIVAGAVRAAHAGTPVVLVGDAVRLRPLVDTELRKRLRRREIDLTVEHAPDAVGMADSPSSVRSRPDTSVRRTVQLVAEGKAAAAVSCGSTGATLFAAVLDLGTLEGADRPAIATMLPRRDGGRLVLLDAGANVDCRPELLASFAQLGAAYAEVSGVPRPRVGLLANGEEDGKGNMQVRATLPLLRSLDLDVVGNVEPSAAMEGACDVLVCDGFVGNVLLKAAEGAVGTVVALLREEIRRRPSGMVGAFLLRGAFKRFRARVAWDATGGALLLGARGVVVVGHGRANAVAVQGAIETASRYARTGLVDAMTRRLAGERPR
ncbi:MAG: phosphate acyltransferase PlsX [Myxococcales bacterium]|nr:phosphate acyltransferase PlsX [Myxococcales bacterium]MCB9671729.1 phosphate acyltransferase PlsX [Alphaproteobacteria bacterium]